MDQVQLLYVNSWYKSFLVSRAGQVVSIIILTHGPYQLCSIILRPKVKHPQLAISVILNNQMKIFVEKTN